MKKSILLFVLAFIFTSCIQPSDETIQKAIYKTQTAEKTPAPKNTSTPLYTLTPSVTPTPPVIDVTNLDLDKLIIQDGDFHSDYLPSEITYQSKYLPSDLDYLADYWISQDIICSNIYTDEPGGVTIGVSNSIAKSKKLYDALLERVEIDESRVEKYKNTDYIELIIGEGELEDGTIYKYSGARIELEEYDLPNLDFLFLSFNKCYINGYIRLFCGFEMEEMTNYVEKLSGRLSNLIKCK